MHITRRRAFIHRFICGSIHTVYLVYIKLPLVTWPDIMAYLPLALKQALERLCTKSNLEPIIHCNLYGMECWLIEHPLVRKAITWRGYPHNTCGYCYSLLCLHLSLCVLGVIKFHAQPYRMNLTLKSEWILHQ